MSGSKCSGDGNGCFVHLTKYRAAAANEMVLEGYRASYLRIDLVQSNDNKDTFYIVETTASERSGDFLKKPNKGSTTTSWKVLFPHRTTPDDLSKPITNDPLYFLVFFYIKPEHVDGFISLLLEEAALVHKLEKGSIRFDLWQSMDEPTEFVVLEVVKDWDALEEHKRMPHYQKVREALWKMQSKPRSHDKGYKVKASQTSHR